MGQEYYLMKTFKIAAATAVLALASGSASAVPSGTANSATSNMNASYTLAKPLSINNVVNITMPTLVVDQAGANVILSPDGTIVYSNGSNPMTTASSNGTAGAVGSFNVNGEAGYYFSVSASNITNGGSDVTLSNITFSTADSGNLYQIGGTAVANTSVTGSRPINVGATLTADNTNLVDSSDFSFDITVTYAGV